MHGSTHGSSQNLCHVRCSRWQGLRYLKFDDIKFRLQLCIWKFIETGFSVDHPQFSLLSYENSVDLFLQKGRYYEFSKPAISILWYVSQAVRFAKLLRPASWVPVSPRNDGV
jgi:hypothetical protein